MSLNRLPADGPQMPPIAGNALDDPRMQEVCRSLRIRVWTRLVPEILIAAVVGVLAALGSRPAQIAAIFVAIACFVMMQIAISNALWLRRIERVLRAYPWEQRLGVKRLDTNERRSRSPHVVKVSRGSGEWSAEMVMSPVLGHRTWEADMSEAIWFAGDERFGGVVAIPGGRAPMFTKPRQWDQLEARRAKAGADEVGSARRAGLNGKKW
ncbi:hypothetical protein ACFY0Z_31645 [Streptomyces kronopolitis]|uniref:hypothetical protein n=1 Tax=Streptomyces kronopolitis TaxID=1612435 RepID=UPI0036A1CF3B